ncbi:MAG: cytochrome c biogenesis protein CcsA [bacterium]|nr:cytochrome c biogenesis protein CcsA [bacterium]
MNITWIVYILMPVSIALAFLWAPPAEFLGDASRIIYFHVPIAWVSVLAFIFSGIASIIYLFDKKKRFFLLEEKAYNSAYIGMVFTILTIITGSIWARISWGVFWNWDPRETSIIILLAIYAAYFSLWSALSENSNRGRISSSYLIFAMIIMPVFIFIIPRVFDSLHPDTIINPEQKVHLEQSMRITLIVSAITFTMLFFYLLSLANRLSIIDKKITEKYE